MRNHLRRQHDIDVEVITSSIRTTATSSIEALYDNLILKIGDASIVNQEIFRRTINQEVINQTLLDLVIVRRLPYSCIEWPELHTLVRALNPAGTVFLPTSHTTMKNMITTWYTQSKYIVRKRLQSSQTSIHLAIDIWTSPSHTLLLAVCASFIGVQNSFRNILIGLRIVEGHSGENQWNSLLPLLQEYGIENKIGAVIGNNATTNNTLCRTMAQWLGSEKKINWNQTFLRLRCFGHILNLVVQAFLFETDTGEDIIVSYDQEDQNTEEVDEKKQKERATEIRTKMGVLGKVHNIVVHIRASPLRMTEFKQEAERTIPLDNRTRWNSWYKMIHVLLNAKILNAVRNYSEKYANEGSLDRKDCLDINDISLLRTMEEFLGVFNSACLFLQGQQATLERVYETIDIIQPHIENSLVCRTIIN